MRDYLEPLGVTQHRVAVAIGVPPRRINEIVHGKRCITADTALRLVHRSDAARSPRKKLTAATLRADAVLAVGRFVDLLIGRA